MHGQSNQSVNQSELLHHSWRDPNFVPNLNPNNVLDYFSDKSNPFYDRQCNNEVILFRGNFQKKNEIQKFMKNILALKNATRRTRTVGRYGRHRVRAYPFSRSNSIRYTGSY